MTETGEMLETTAEERTSWQVLRTTRLARAARDIDRLLTDTEAKARQIRELRDIIDFNSDQYERLQSEHETEILRLRMIYGDPR